jgi:hypothetical protein
LIALYNAVFRAASGDSAHISLDALNRHVRADMDANIQGLRFGPDVSDLPDTLSIAISAFGLAVFTAIELFDLPSFNDELAQCMDEWKSLGIPSEGMERHRIEGVEVAITDPARTIVDCFRYRAKVGIDVAMEGLREGLRQRKATSDQLWRYATKARIWSTMKPYVEATAADGT